MFNNHSQAHAHQQQMQYALQQHQQQQMHQLQQQLVHGLSLPPPMMLAAQHASGAQHVTPRLMEQGIIAPTGDESAATAAASARANAPYGRPPPPPVHAMTTEAHRVHTAPIKPQGIRMPVAPTHHAIRQTDADAHKFAQPNDQLLERYRAYLERTGVMSTLMDAITRLFLEHDKGTERAATSGYCINSWKGDPIAFIARKLHERAPDAVGVQEAQREASVLRDELTRVNEENVALRERLARLEATMKDSNIYSHSAPKRQRPSVD